MDGHDIYRVGFIFGQRFSKHFRRNYLLFYAGFVEGLHSQEANKAHKKDKKGVVGSTEKAVGSKDFNMSTTEDTN